MAVVITLSSDSDESPECALAPPACIHRNPLHRKACENMGQDDPDDSEVVCLGVRKKRQRGNSPLPIARRRRPCADSDLPASCMQLNPSHPKADETCDDTRQSESDDNEVVCLGVRKKKQKDYTPLPIARRRRPCMGSDSTASFYNEFISSPQSGLGTDTDSTDADASDCCDSSLDSVLGGADAVTLRMDNLMHEAECCGHEREGCLDTNQLRVIRLIRAAKDAGRAGFAILWALGGGKTRAAIGSLTTHRQSDTTKALALVPLSVMAQWKAEAHVLGVKVHIYHGSASHRQLDPDAELTVTTRETLAAEMRSRNYHVLCQPWTEIIVDEAHRFANLRARAGEKTRDYAKVISRLQRGRNHPFFTALTGTPASRIGRIHHPTVYDPACIVIDMVGTVTVRAEFLLLWGTRIPT